MGNLGAGRAEKLTAVRDLFLRRHGGNYSDLRKHAKTNGGFLHFEKEDRGSKALTLGNAMQDRKIGQDQ